MSASGWKMWPQSPVIHNSRVMFARSPTKRPDLSRRMLSTSLSSLAADDWMSMVDVERIGGRGLDGSRTNTDAALWPSPDPVTTSPLRTAAERSESNHAVHSTQRVSSALELRREIHSNHPGIANSGLISLLWSHGRGFYGSPFSSPLEALGYWV